MKIIRKFLGAIIVFIDKITRPKPMKRSEEDQRKIDEQTKGLSLYQFHACPFCVKVRRVIHRLNLKIELRDVQKNQQFEKELIEGGGKRKVPCLRLQENGSVRWMYESNNIISNLEKKFS